MEIFFSNIRVTEQFGLRTTDLKNSSAEITHSTLVKSRQYDDIPFQSVFCVDFD